MLRLSEMYSSIQGEGVRVGLPTTFVRFAGCNMRCPGWPCDTPHAIEPSIWVKESEKVTALELAERISNEVPRNICLTGGEPFLQKEEELHELIVSCAPELTWEVFTNGSFPFPQWALDRLHFTMDWKLKGSGEAETYRGVRTVNALSLKETDDIKFVVKDEADLREAMTYAIVLRNRGYRGGFLVGAVWSEINDEFIVSWMLEQGIHDWRLNVQTHKYIWMPEERRV